MSGEKRQREHKGCRASIRQTRWRSFRLGIERTSSHSFPPASLPSSPRRTGCSLLSVLVLCGACTCHGVAPVVHGFLFTRGSGGTSLHLSSDSDYSLFISPLQYLILHLTPQWALNSICWMNKPELVRSDGGNMLIGCHALKGRSFKKPVVQHEMVCLGMGVRACHPWRW